MVIHPLTFSLFHKKGCSLSSCNTCEQDSPQPLPRGSEWQPPPGQPCLRQQNVEVSAKPTLSHKACLHFQQRGLLPFTDASPILSPKSMFFMHFKKILFLRSLRVGTAVLPTLLMRRQGGPLQKDNVLLCLPPPNPVSIISYIRSADRTEKLFFLSTLCSQSEEQSGISPSPGNS